MITIIKFYIQIFYCTEKKEGSEQRLQIQNIQFWLWKKKKKLTRNKDNWLNQKYGMVELDKWKNNIIFVIHCFFFSINIRFYKFYMQKYKIREKIRLKHIYTKIIFIERGK